MPDNTGVELKTMGLASSSWNYFEPPFNHRSKICKSELKLGITAEIIFNPVKNYCPSVMPLLQSNKSVTEVI